MPVTAVVVVVAVVVAVVLAAVVVSDLNGDCAITQSSKSSSFVDLSNSAYVAYVNIPGNHENHDCRKIEFCTEIILTE